MAKKQQHVGAAARLLWSVSPIVDIDCDGWPVKLHVQAIAALQSWRDGDGEETPELQQRLADWAYAIRGACTDSKTLPHERRVLRQNPMVMGGDVVGVVTDSAYYITALDFSEWLAVHGEAPSPLVQLWFKHQDVASPAPAPAPAQAAAEPAPVVGDSASNARVVPFKKAALIAAHVHEWPTIERDISDANANGLATAAKADARGWREADALTWARAKGKLIRAAKPADSLTQAMHNLGALPSRKHTMQG